jgi:succinate-semialdehyde dehydrogenase/glutarate-semialdehyde dehydrogenase
MVQGVAIVDGCIVNTNPATGEVISCVPCTPSDKLDELVQTAVKAQVGWNKTATSDRIECLKRGLATIAQDQDKLVQLIVQEMGKPMAQAKEEVAGAVDRNEYFRLLEQSLEPKRLGKDGSSVVVRSALGAVVVLSPWNYPADEILLLALPALGSGNTVIVKPSEVTPESGTFVVRALQSALPEGVLQLAQGDGVVGSALVSHPNVAMIAMTGSSATGQKIMAEAAPKLKRIVLELGGKDPMIVFGDADLDKAAKDAVEYSLSNTGQVCCSIERIYVADDIYSDFQQRVATIAKSYKVGNGMDPDVNVGPLVSSIQRDLVKAHVDDALQKGATLLHQSTVPTEESLKNGTFYPVTVLSDVQDGMDMYRDETFGPVVSLTSFDGSEEEGIRLANDTVYGLGSAVYTSDMERARRVANAIQAGQVGINCYSLENMDIACPWVGHKQSGFGYHSGQEGFHQFSVPKSLIYAPGQAP